MINKQWVLPLTEFNSGEQTVFHWCLYPSFEMCCLSIMRQLIPCVCYILWNKSVCFCCSNKCFPLVLLCVLSASCPEPYNGSPYIFSAKAFSSIKPFTWYLANTVCLRLPRVKSSATHTVQGLVKTLCWDSAFDCAALCANHKCEIQQTTASSEHCYA